MTQSFITQCPQCRTSFRVNHAQLGAAHGAVRCGACLHVFNAVQQLRESGALATPPAPQPSSRPAPPSAPAPAPAKTETPSTKADDTLWIHDDLDLDNLDLDEELAKLEAQEQAFSRQFLAAEAAPNPGERFLQASEPEPEVDESWTQALLRDTPSTPTAPEPAPQPQPAPKQPASPAPGAAPSTPPQPKHAAPRDPVTALPIKDIEISARRDTPAAGTPSIRARNDEPSLDEPLPGEPSPASSKPQRSEPALRSDSLFELDEEPLQLDWRPQQRKPWGRWLGWGLLNLLAASALAGQYVSYNFAEMARQDQYRPWFEQLCPLIDCKLPSKVDVSQVKSSNLVVRSHPQFAGALVVDAIIYNRAAFTQPFPLLEMRFADINGQLLASRRFKPGEYLAGELAGQAQMPPQTPIHISMDILDPGTQAVNYSIHFHSPE